MKTKKFPAFLIVVTIVFASLGLESAYAQPNHFVVLYNFDENKGDVAIDLSGTGNDGQITDCKWIKEGKFGGGIEFNGTSGVIEVPHHDSLNPGGDQITVMAWYKPFSLSAAYPPIARKGSVAEKGWGLDIPTNTLRGWVVNAAQEGILATGATPLELEKWQHVAMTYDGKEIKVYINGEFDGNVACSGNINKNSGSLWISKKADESQYLHGVMDEFAVLNTAITGAEILEYMQIGPSVVKASDKLAISWGEVKIQ